MKHIPMVLILVLLDLACFRQSMAAEPPLNILFIAVDDLRPQLGCYGQNHVQSPNLDRLASQGVLFERAYCMVPTCGASRASLMTSIRPAPKRFVTHLTYAEKDAPGITTLNTHLKQHGYYTVSNGKVFHHPEDNAIGWSEPAWRPGQPSEGVPLLVKNGKGSGKNKNKSKSEGKDEDGQSRGRPFAMSEQNDDELSDGQVALKTIVGDASRRVRLGIRDSTLQSIMTMGPASARAAGR